jgi:predicted HicB family RNase H-like nuclease
MNVKTRLDPEIHAAAKIAAAKEGISLTEYLRRLVQSDLQRRSMNTRASSSGNRGDRNANSDSERIR